MPLDDHLRPGGLGEQNRAILELAIAYDKAMQGREFSLGKVIRLTVFLAKQLAITEATLEAERRGRMADRESALKIIQHYKRSFDETQKMMERFDWIKK